MAEEFDYLAKFPPVSEVSKYREELELRPGALGWRHSSLWISRIINLCKIRFGCTISCLLILPHTILFKRTLEVKQDVLNWERIHNSFLESVHRHRL